MRTSKEEKAMWLEDWQRSGKSAWMYAKENGLVPQTFVKWAQAAKESKHCFVEVSAQVMQTVQQAKEILIEKGDVKIHIPLSLSNNELHAVMAGIGSII